MMLSDLSSLWIRLGNSIRQNMTCFDCNDAQIALVADKGLKLPDTMTDGDVRRAIPAGVDLDTPVSSAARSRRFCREGDDSLQGTMISARFKDGSDTGVAIPDNPRVRSLLRVLRHA